VSAVDVESGAGDAVRHTSVANVDEPIGFEGRSDRGPRSSSDRESKIVIVSGYAKRLLVAQPMSTGPSGDCETPFFPDDSDVSATEPRPISPFRALSEVDRTRCRS
jgi:hypothetical protein